MQKILTEMDFVHVYILILHRASLVSLIILLKPTTSAFAEFYTINDRHIPVASSSGKTSLPISVHSSQTECIIRCSNRTSEGGEILQPFLSNQKECFCLKNDQQEQDILTEEKGKIVNGSLFIKVSVCIN